MASNDDVTVLLMDLGDTLELVRASLAQLDHASLSQSSCMKSAVERLAITACAVARDSMQLCVWLEVAPGSYGRSRRLM